VQQAVQQVGLVRAGRLAQFGGVRTGAGHCPLTIGATVVPGAAGRDSGGEAEAHEEESHECDEDTASLDHPVGSPLVSRGRRRAAVSRSRVRVFCRQGRLLIGNDRQQQSLLQFLLMSLGLEGHCSERGDSGRLSAEKGVTCSLKREGGKVGR
jgi:hypothetical protein